jgi:hypothetical protein
MTEFHERWGLVPRYTPLNSRNRRHWIVWLGRCIDTARASMWSGS